MIYLFKGGSIVFDESVLSDEEKGQAWTVEYLPEPEEREGYYSEFKFDFNKREMWYEYHLKEETAAERIEALKTENVDLKLALAEMAESQEQQRLETQLALAELAEAMSGGVE